MGKTLVTFALYNCNAGREYTHSLQRLFLLRFVFVSFSGGPMLIGDVQVGLVSFGQVSSKRMVIQRRRKQLQATD